MATILYFKDATASGSSAGSLSLTQPGTSTTNTGNSDLGGFEFGPGDYEVTYNAVGSGAFGASLPPAALAASAADCFRSEGVLSGLMIGNWSYNLPYHLTQSGTGGSFTLAIRLWKGTAADGSNATNFLGRTIGTFRPDTADGNFTFAGTGFVNPGTIAFNSEYLFFQLAISSAGDSTDAILGPGLLLQVGNPAGFVAQITAPLIPVGELESATPGEASMATARLVDAEIEGVAPGDASASAARANLAAAEAAVLAEQETASIPFAQALSEAVAVGEAENITGVRAVDAQAEALTVVEQENISGVRAADALSEAVAVGEQDVSQLAGGSRIAEPTIAGEADDAFQTKGASYADAPVADAAFGTGPGATSASVVEGPTAREGADGIRQGERLGRIDDSPVAIDAQTTALSAVVITNEAPVAAEVENVAVRWSVREVDGAIADAGYAGLPPPAITAAFAVTWRSVRFVIDPADTVSVFAATVPGGALNPASWIVQGFTVLVVRQVDAHTFDVVVEGQLPSHLQLVTVGCDGLIINGQDIHQTFPIHGMTWREAFTPGAAVAQKRGVGVDLANRTTFRQSSVGVGGTLVVQGGDYATVTGPELVKKLILRRLATPRGGFFHLPEYGVGVLQSKELVHPNDLVKMRAEIERQCRLEPEVVAVRASVSITASGISTVVVLAATAPSGDVVQVTSTSAPGQGA